MRVLCRHGHIAFYPTSPTDVRDFVETYGIELIRVGDFYTFGAIAAAPRYSIEGHKYLTVTATKTFEGRGPWDIFRENNWVYSISTAAIVLKTSVNETENLLLSNDCFVSTSALIQPGAKNMAGDRILSYDAEFDARFQRLKVREVQFV